MNSLMAAASLYLTINLCVVSAAGRGSVPLSVLPHRRDYHGLGALPASALCATQTDGVAVRLSWDALAGVDELCV